MSNSNIIQSINSDVSVKTKPWTTAQKKKQQVGQMPYNQSQSHNSLSQDEQGKATENEEAPVSPTQKSFTSNGNDGGKSRVSRREEYINILLSSSVGSRTQVCSKKEIFEQQNPKIAMYKHEPFECVTQNPKNIYTFQNPIVLSPSHRALNNGKISPVDAIHSNPQASINVPINQQMQRGKHASGRQIQQASNPFIQIQYSRKINNQIEQNARNCLERNQQMKSVDNGINQELHKIDFPESNLHQTANPSKRNQSNNFSYIRNANLNVTDFTNRQSVRSGLTPIINMFTTARTKNYRARKLSPLNVNSPRLINHADYREYAATTGVVSTDEKLQVLSKIDSTSKFNILAMKPQTNDQSKQELSLGEPEISQYINFKMMKSSQSNADSWVNVPQHYNRESELQNHKVRRKQVDELILMIKEAEKSLKERKRRNQKLKKEILADQSKVFEQLQVSHRLDPPASNSEVTSKQDPSEVHGFYNNLIKGNMQSVCDRTQHMVDVMRQNNCVVREQIEDLRQQNINLKRSNKYYQEAIAYEQDKKKDVALVEDSQSMGSYQLSQKARNEGGGHGSDGTKIEKINRHVQQMIHAKFSLDCALSIIKSCKDAFKHANRVTLFVVDSVMQAILLKGQKKMARHYKQFEIEDSPSGVIHAVFDLEEEQCTPYFRDMKTGSTQCFTQKMISIPVIENEILYFTLQIETDCQPIVIKANNNKVGKRKQSLSQGSKNNLNQSNYSRTKTTALNSNDLIVARIICMLGQARFEVFTNTALDQKKSDMKMNIIEFVQRFTNIKNFKDLMRSIKFEVPKLLDFKAANIYIYDSTQENMKALNIDEDAERFGKKEDPNSFLQDFNIDERSIVRFPRNMGVSGFALENDAITYLNDIRKILLRGQTAVLATCVAVSQTYLTPIAQKLLHPRLTEKYPFNSKIDNFIEVPKLQNFLISSIRDEADIGSPVSVGVLQLYNKLGSDVTEDDLRRVYYIRKLIGACTVKCEEILMTLQTTLGLNNDELAAQPREGLKKQEQGQQEGLQISEKWVEQVLRDLFENPVSQSMQINICSMLKRNVDSAAALNILDPNVNKFSQAVGEALIKQYVQKNMIGMENQ